MTEGSETINQQASPAEVGGRSRRPGSAKRKMTLSGRWMVVFAVGVALLVAGTSVAASGVLAPGDVIRGGDQLGDAGSPVEETVLASGSGDVAGPWVLTAYEGQDSGSPDGPQPCVRVTLTSPPEGTLLQSTGFCGEPGPSGVMSASLPVKNADGATELLVVGRAPETAAKVRLVEDGQVAVEAAVTPSQSTAIGGNVWVMSIPAEISEGELEWVDTDSNVTAPGSPTSGWFDRLDAIKRIGKPPT